MEKKWEPIEPFVIIAGPNDSEAEIGKWIDFANRLYGGPVLVKRYFDEKETSQEEG